MYIYSSIKCLSKYLRIRCTCFVLGPHLAFSVKKRNGTILRISSHAQREEAICLLNSYKKNTNTTDKNNRTFSV